MRNHQKNQFKMLLTSKFMDVKIIFFYQKLILKGNLKNPLKEYFLILLYGGK